MIRYFAFLVLFAVSQAAFASYIFVPMGPENQKDHLKAYGITYWVLENGVEAYWLLNYDGGSFAFEHTPIFEKECKTRGISYKVVPNAKFASIRQKIADPELNEEVIKLEKAPKIAVYTPDFNTRGERIQPWDDAVTMVLTYAEIPYDQIYDREVMEDKLAEYDWLHLHHEDFSGQYGKFYASYHNKAWYRENVSKMQGLAKSLGFAKVSQLKLAVVKRIREYVGAGGFMFAMCSATDTYDLALAAEGTDICHQVFDGDPMNPNAQNMLDYSKTFAFKDFQIIKNHLEYETSSIDHRKRKIIPERDYFSLS